MPVTPVFRKHFIFGILLAAQSRIPNSQLCHQVKRLTQKNQRYLLLDQISPHRFDVLQAHQLLQVRNVQRLEIPVLQKVLSHRLLLSAPLIHGTDYRVSLKPH
ncbi:hypothetical protein OESDEN_19726 [Oesophagostomum dentatum]|uniref:Uncharacterized protein n=1 Tax=Oesophagostomum dentatum TaxID=61180 RepID=A0A0B1SAQ5_OESDE|nr:hypothetical protein OESDEN_19726 [Oesophagostomum dentatum]